MADPRFFKRAGPFTLTALAALSGATLIDEATGGRLMVDVAPLDSARPDEVTFLDNRKYLGAFETSHAGAAFVAKDLAGRAPAGMAVLVSGQPYKAYALAAQAFYPMPRVEPTVGATARIDPTASVPADCEIGEHVVIGAGAKLGARCQIGANSVIGPAVELGDDCRVAPNVTLSHCVIGARVVLHPGVRIGQPGFGFAPDPVRPVKVPQLGRVVIGDDVDIGANSTIDRGSGHDTEIGAGTMIDNLVQIAHNVRIGRGCVIVSQVGIAGSAVLGDYVMIGGQAGVIGHLRIGAGARIAGKAGVTRDIAAGDAVGGSPAVPMTEWVRTHAMLRRMVLKKDKG